MLNIQGVPLIFNIQGVPLIFNILFRVLYVYYQVFNII